ncbi:hypothetical protein KCP73_06860 [Salmonella enterica subsp. enterica]|nr:hypothetical protein KCP73_06860 [Salmonella enterica subsp. enterica]
MSSSVLCMVTDDADLLDSSLYTPSPGTPFQFKINTVARQSGVMTALTCWRCIYLTL